MNPKEKIAGLLNENAGEFVSGEFLARECGITRSAVWKAIASLRERGYEIEAKTNAGYRLSGDVLDGSAILSAAGKALASRIRVEVFGKVDSTNRIARERAAAGEHEGLVICADAQNAGRGRMGRTFFSPGGTGLYMSVLLRPDAAASHAVGITTAAAVAVCRAIDAVLGIDAGIKWVNDIIVGDRKVCGILTEAAMSVESGSLDFAVLGIGINICAPRGGFPPEIADTAGALISSPRAGLKNALCAAILSEFFALYDRLGENPQIDEYRKRSVILGHRVTVAPLSGERERSAVAEEITEDAALVVRYHDGTCETLTSGEVRVRI